MRSRILESLQYLWYYDVFFFSETANSITLPELLKFPEISSFLHVKVMSTKPRLFLFTSPYPFLLFWKLTMIYYFTAHKEICQMHLFSAIYVDGSFHMQS